MSDHEGSGKPPRGRPFRKGQSGNPKGRPPKQPQSESGSPFDVIADKTVAVTQDGETLELTVEEALQWKVYQDALAGKVSAQRKILRMIEKREKYLEAQTGRRSFPKVDIRLEGPDPTNADEALKLLGIVGPHPYGPEFGGDREALILELWAVQAALERRRGGHQLTEQHIRKICQFTRDPENLRWPRGTET